MFAIGAFARLCGVSAKALRAYDGLGLFRPVWVEPSSGYRFYSPAQLPAIPRIVALRGVGVPLAEIGRLLSGGADLDEVLRRRRAELESERREVERGLAGLEIRVGRGPGDLDVVVRRVQEEPVATLAMDLVPNGDVAAAFHELETHVRDAGRRAPRPPGALVPDDGEVEIFVPVTRSIVPTDRIGFRRLPAARVATAIHRGPYAGMHAVTRALEDWTAATRLVRAGPMRILYLQFGAEAELRVPRGYVVERVGDFVTELQLPIT